MSIPGQSSFDKESDRYADESSATTPFLSDDRVVEPSSGHTSAPRINRYLVLLSFLLSCSLLLSLGSNAFILRKSVHYPSPEAPNPSSSPSPHAQNDHAHHDNGDKKLINDKTFGQCGHGIEAARASGCKFDVMTFSWVKPECYREDLISSFLQRTDWHFYSNETLEPQHELDLDEVIAGDHPTVYTGFIYHPIHCTYMWRKMHKAFIEHLPIDNDTPQEHHTEHCDHIMLGGYLGEYHHECEKVPDSCHTRLKAGYTYCGYV